MGFEGAVAVAVFEDFDAVEALADFAGFGVAVAFDDPDAAAFVEGEGDGLDEVGFGGDEFGFEAGGELDVFEGVLGGLAFGVVFLGFEGGAVPFRISDFGLRIGLAILR